MQPSLRDDQSWAWAALILGVALVSLVGLDAFVLHPGYAFGDETDVIALVQRIREGAPLDLRPGCIHRCLMLASLSLWPGQLWASSLPAMLALALEGALLFGLGKRVGGARLGFFSVLVGMASAFTLVRARSALSFALFPAEWLLIVWLRLRCSKPWHWALWGCGLGLLTFEYDAFIPAAALLVLAPFPETAVRRQRAWELAGLVLVLVLFFDLGSLTHYWQRRQAASLAQAGSQSPGWWAGLKDLVLGGASLPYLEPAEHGVLPVWLCLAMLLGSLQWARQRWVPLAYLAVGVSLPLLGGALYGLPAHRVIVAWPVIALVAARGLEGLWAWAPSRRVKGIFALGLGLAVAQELRAWNANQRHMDADFRGPIRDLQRAARAGLQESRRTGFPLVTELHPMQGAQFRFLTGTLIPLPDAKAPTVVAFLQWSYLPAIRHQVVSVATFQENAGYPPAFLAVLRGPLAQQAIEAEREFRPLLLKRTQGSAESTALVLDWLQASPKAGPWARTLAVDYRMTMGWNRGRLDVGSVQATLKEAVVSSHPLLLAAQFLERTEAAQALAVAHRARLMDPNNAGPWQIERRLLDRFGRLSDIKDLDQAMEPLASKGLLYAD